MGTKYIKKGCEGCRENYWRNGTTSVFYLLVGSPVPQWDKTPEGFDRIHDKRRRFSFCVHRYIHNHKSSDVDQVEHWSGLGLRGTISPGYKSCKPEDETDVTKVPTSKYSSTSTGVRTRRPTTDRVDIRCEKLGRYKRQSTDYWDQG